MLRLRFPLLLLALFSPGLAQNIDLRAAGAALFIENRFHALDKNKDGKLDAEESKSVADIVRGSDTDGDSLFSLDEVLTHFRKQAELLAKPRPQALAGLMAPEIEQRFKQFDKNGDGKLADEELSQARWLKKLDVNHDGAVTLEEAQTFFATLSRPEPAMTAEAPPNFEPTASPRQEPRPLKANDYGVGAMVPDVAFNDLENRQHHLADFATGKAVVIAMASPSCPVSKRYLPSLAALEKEFAGKAVAFVLVAPIATDTPEMLRTAFHEAGLAAPCVPDPTCTLARMLGALATTDVFVLDAKRTLVYRGALDDQYGLGYSLDAPRHRYVADALEATLTGRAPSIPATEAPGCALDLGSTRSVELAGEVTYHNRISRLIQSNCQECHRAGGVAPFGLETYEQVTAKAGMIRRMVERGLMPPWFAKAGEADGHSPWLNDRSLPERDRTDLLAWLGNGKPVGDAKDAPLGRTWPGEWAIGTPDAEYQIPNPIDIKATGVMSYQNVTVDTGLTEDKWVRALEVKPTAREVVHHVLIFVHGPEAGRREEDGAHGFFAAYVPGNDHIVYPDGFAKPLPAGSRLVFQIHYTPNGVATKDQVRFGVLFGKSAPEHIVQTVGIAGIGLRIPPNTGNHPESATIPVPQEVRLLGFMPHMHVRGQAFRYEVLLPDGSARTLLDIPRYDFNWQLGYRFAEPPLIPAGSKVRATGWYDNTANNPANPDPNKQVRWGPQTYDEMMIGYVEFYVPSESGKKTAAR